MVKKGDGLSTYVQKGFGTQQIKPLGRAASEFIWLKVLNLKVSVNFVTVYFAVGEMKGTGP